MEIVQDKWKEILQRVRDEHELSEISFTTWIEPLTIHSVEDNLITILASHPFQFFFGAAGDHRRTPDQGNHRCQL